MDSVKIVSFAIFQKDFPFGANSSEREAYHINKIEKYEWKQQQQKCEKKKIYILKTRANWMWRVTKRD